MNTDYTVREVRRTRDDLVTYTVCDTAGVVRHVTVPFARSLPGDVDPVVRATIAATVPHGRITR